MTIESRPFGKLAGDRNRTCNETAHRQGRLSQFHAPRLSEGYMCVYVEASVWSVESLYRLGLSAAVFFFTVGRIEGWHSAVKGSVHKFDLTRSAS